MSPLECILSATIVVVSIFGFSSIMLRVKMSRYFLLAPTGALIMTVVYYSISIGPLKPLFEIFEISANIFSLSFRELNAD